MASQQSVSVAGIDTDAWCAQLAGTLDYLLAHRDEEGAWVIAREVVKNYDAAITRASEASDQRDNVIPLFSLHDVIDQVLPS